MSQLSYWLIASVLLVATFWYRTYRAKRTLAGRLEEERQRARQMSELHLATIEALALAIDAKDQTTYNHVGRVELYASSLARALGMSEADQQAVKTAALLHDIGKLAVPEHILAKPGPLTPDEFQKVRMHPQIGADIINAVPFPYPVAPLVLHHHERWDGRGYPMGLKGEQIPLGARILCLVDYFDALTSDRPYHKPLSIDAAAALIQEEAGKALDPLAVDAFLRILPELRSQMEGAIMERPRPMPAMPASEGAPIAGSPRAAAMSRASVFEDIAVAHREIYALYELAQSMGTTLGVTETMGHIASKLSRVVPFSTCSLFLYSEDDDTLQCRFASGTDAELLQQLVLKNGQGLTGWVARNRRPLVNGRPSADFNAAGSVLQTALESALVCPLISGNAVIGVLAVYHTAEAFYCDDHRRLLDRVCEQASAVIRNAIVFDQTHEASLTDPLTGLPNTRFMFRHLTRELARTHRLGAEVSILVLDLNGFKDINDTYGHHAGDRALREVSNVLRALVRPYDVCARYAGDEFVIVLAGCSRDEAENKRRELQRGVEQIVFEPAPGTQVPMSISVGAAVFPHDGETYESLLAAADRRMYQDKSARRRDVQRQLSAARVESGPVPEYDASVA
ncbi:MAG TPA: HD domain-containing phosphohydrolase [Vicinamibacterales bacterium]|nr:HD domain-containing phosphohydrolase [Vicinamibacterales bacterium]